MIFKNVNESHLFFLYLGIITVHQVLAHDIFANGGGPHAGPVGQATRGGTPQCYPSLRSVSDFCERESYSQLHHSLLFSAGETNSPLFLNKFR